MISERRLLLIGAAAVVGFVGVGCGGASDGPLSKGAYASKLRDALGKPLPWAKHFDLRHSTTAQLADAGRLAKEQSLEVAAELSTLRPPRDAVADHRKIVAYVRGSAVLLPAEIKAESAALNSGAGMNSAVWLAFVRRENKLLRQTGVEGALRDLKSKGYDLGDLARGLG